MELQLDHEVIGDHDVLTPHGEVDLASFVTLRDAINALLESGRCHLVVDLAQTTFLDSTALGCLIGGRRKAADAGGTFTVLVDSPPLLRLLEITKLDQVFDLAPDRASWQHARAR